MAAYKNGKKVSGGRTTTGRPNMAAARAKAKQKASQSKPKKAKKLGTRTGQRIS
jgi:hypothetical protein